jgi:hypothetical protein
MLATIYSYTAKSKSAIRSDLQIDHINTIRQHELVGTINHSHPICKIYGISERDRSEDINEQLEAHSS